MKTNEKKNTSAKKKLIPAVAMLTEPLKKSL